MNEQLKIFTAASIPELEAEYNRFMKAGGLGGGAIKERKFQAVDLGDKDYGNGEGAVPDYLYVLLIFWGPPR